MNRATQKILIISIVSSFVLGILLFLFHTDIIIVRSPFRIQKNVEHLEKLSGSKRSVDVYYWYENSMHSEQASIVWDGNVVQNLSRLIGLWLDIIHNEQLLDRKVKLESVSISQESNCVYASFSAPIFSSEDPIYIKWNMIEGLLKTIGKMFTSVREVFFLVNHQPMKDSHLDFSQAWPIEGFSQDQAV